LSQPEITRTELELQPLDVRHVARLRELHLQPGVLRWWGPMEPLFPFDEPESQRFAIVVAGAVAGLIQYGEESWPGSRHAYVDIFVGDDYAGRGLGTEALTRIVRLLVEERGHHHISIDPQADNPAAIRCYEKAGFERVGVRRRFSRNSEDEDWRDELLMQYVVTDPRS
jgi:aminoglycoside 6'-N-acetyltransferase